ncbi:SCO family protein [Saccharospirillum alexandrii]|uniref:SCO family protein n=1 Tax=Saccharospirillum alexandrii TaxID=2448477 RepID=UPI000FDCA385|nr:SCO family protein [Saccharospirillum alexandrii]
MQGNRLIPFIAPPAILMVLFGFALWVIAPAVPSLPTIQGAWLMPAQPLPAFRLEQHNGPVVTPDTLPGNWHLISYGFTHCPDICPTTLVEMAQFKRALDRQSQFTDLRLHFYTVDPGRDSLAQLADYLPWFHEQFSGWRAVSDQDAEAFESALGIHASVTQDEQGSVQVTHGLTLFLINNDGRLQAVFEPTRTLTGRLHFEPDRLLQDYLTVRRWANNHQL